MGQVGWEQMETGAFPPPWARGALSSAGLVAVTQRRESCWGLSPPQGLPGRGPCHTLLLGGLFPELGWPVIQPAPLCPLWSPMLLSPVSLWSLMLLSLLSPVLLSPFIPLVTSPMLLSPLSLWSLMLLCSFIPVVTDGSVPWMPLVMRLDLCHRAQPAARGHRALWGPATGHH